MKEPLPLLEKDRQSGNSNRREKRRGRRERRKKGKGSPESTPMVVEKCA